MHNYHCVWPRGVFVASCMTLKLHGGTCADVFLEFGPDAVVFFILRGTSGSSLVLLGVILAPVGLCFCVFLALWGVVPNPLNTFGEKL